MNSIWDVIRIDVAEIVTSESESI